MDSSTSGKFFITGATGSCGSAAVNYLYQNFPNIKIIAGVRDPKKAKETFPQILRNLEFALVDENLQNKTAKEELVRSMKGCDAVFIVPPGEGRIEIGKAYTEAAKLAGVKFIAMVSVASIGVRDTLFARQFREIETAVMATGIRHCFLRCELFIDNHLGDAESVKKEKAFYMPVLPDIKYNPVATSDVGAMAATLMVKSLMPQTSQMPQMPISSTSKMQTTTTTISGQEKTRDYTETTKSSSTSAAAGGMMMGGNGNSQIYHLTTSKPITLTEMASIYSKIVKADVKYVQVSRTDGLHALMKKGVPKWQAEGIIELLDMINDGLNTTASTDIEKVLGRKAVTVDEFLFSHGNQFMTA
jgi:uncharacterized protein YbjT (DUF2867 family)